MTLSEDEAQLLLAIKDPETRRAVAAVLADDGRSELRPGEPVYIAKHDQLGKVYLRQADGRYIVQLDDVSPSGIVTTIKDCPRQALVKLS